MAGDDDHVVHTSMIAARRLVFTSRRLMLRRPVSTIRLRTDNDLTLHAEFIVKRTEVLIRAW